jgi:hypothetical protein
MSVTCVAIFDRLPVERTIPHLLSDFKEKQRRTATTAAVVLMFQDPIPQ